MSSTHHINHFSLRGRRFWLALWVCLLGLATQGRAEIRQVVLISVDGLRGDFLEELLRTAPEEVPTFVRLRETGASTCNARTDYTVSLTIPDHLCMITSRPVEQIPGLANTIHHGYIGNDGTLTTVHANGNPAVAYKASIFDVVHDAGLSTAAYLSKSRLNILIRSYDATHGAPDTVGADNGRNKVDMAGYYVDPTPLVQTAAALVAAIEDDNLKNFTMLHITEPDYAGHGYGWTIAPGSNYRGAVQSSDIQLGWVIDAIIGKPQYAGSTAIIVTADHGGGGEDPRGHFDSTYLQNVTIPFFVIAPGLSGGTDLYQWMENRFDPKLTRPDYFSPTQPLRNGDAGNLAAGLLGLAPIPNSYFRPMFKRPLTVAFDAAAGAKLSWPLYLTGHTLEVSDKLIEWAPVTAGITETATERRYLDPLPLPAGRFYRLRAP